LKDSKKKGFGVGLVGSVGFWGVFLEIIFRVVGHPIL
jgi:hypothetical protein